MKKLVQFGNVLSKDQQRKIIGGDYGNTCIFCEGFGEACGNPSRSCWYREDQDIGACHTIYSGCGYSIGTLGVCQDWCTMHN